jgi:hypothetical protein
MVTAQATIRRRACLGAATCLAGVALVGAGAPALGAGAPSLRASPDPVQAGHVVRLTGSAGDCPGGDTVLLLSRVFPRVHEFAGVPTVLASVRSGGRFRARVRIPRIAPPGVYTVSGRCGGGNLGFALALRVTESVPVTG